ncbi:F-box family protein [Rhynchospora pubera]|uniref:F-box family protein n=1 Tax=Rhynchospora pubera TaxID=906938 RepID=A0AAV8DT71_9POAL|nr:F-box family protein [Rhynchospora pubera]
MTTASTANRRRKENYTTVRNWSELPDGPLHTILTCLCSFVDFISFSSVCRSWRALASSLSPSQITSRFPPLLFIASYTHEGRVSSCRVLDPASPSFSCSLDRICTYANFPFLVNLSSHGRFLLLVGRPEYYRYVILNPFTGEEIYSPIMPKDHTSFDDFYPTCLFYPTYLSFIDSVLLLFTDDTVFHWRIGSSSWSCHSLRIHPSDGEMVAIVNGTVYAMDFAGRLFVLDLSPELHLRQLAVDEIGVGGFSFLVDYGGELLFLHLVSTEMMIGMQFEAFRLDLSANQARWVKMETLGNWAIFAGYSTQLQGLAVENPERWGGRSNCLYFATEVDDDRPWTVIKLGDEIDTDTMDPGLLPSNKMITWVYPGF